MHNDALAKTELGIMHQVNSHQWTRVNAELGKVCIL